LRIVNEKKILLMTNDRLTLKFNVCAFVK
jgi:hypothetical protein